MPQMSPMPWMMLLIMTLMMIMIMCTYIYFYNQKSNYTNLMFNKKKFSIKW
uniref:ATP synthase F0 subunit 8 n=1 Tax=Trioza erytreae TaxID=1778831 RepID=A0A6M8YJL9_TRIEB|nr:ATP synthase F0 subunit 8 [Trioza erytreae]QKK36469.1 ATP synthase F0 subunit 8 [Trioza erytreae]